MSARRVANLDALRGLAALAVLASHAYFLGGRAIPIKAEHPYDVGLSFLTSGVWLFFALSGYVISRPFLDRLVDSRPLPATGSYLLRRAVRILPLYWVTVTAYALLEGHPGVAAWQLPIHYLLLNNLDPGQQLNLYPVAWTLTLEMLFYLVVPLLAVAARARWAAPRAQTLARAIAISWLASIAFTGFADLQGDGTVGLWARGSLPAMWQMFCPGLLLALAPHLKATTLLTRAGDWRRVGWWTVCLGCLAGAGLLSAAAPLGHGLDVYELLVDASRPLFAVGYGLIVAAAIAARPWRHRGLIAVGAASYGIYLLHPLIATVLTELGLVPLARDTLPAFIVHLVLLAVLTVPLALASWRWLESPLIAWARRRGTTGADDMRAFWNARAREDALFFVDNRRAYRSDADGTFWSEAAELIDHFLGGLEVGLRPDDDVLEIGCGVGRMTRVLAARSRSVIALDVSDEMLTRARDLNPSLPGVRWTLGDGRTLSVCEPASVDACVSTVVLQHVPDPAITLGYVRELGRVLRPTGWAALQVSTDPAVHRARGGWWRRLAALAGRGPRGQRHRAWLGTPVTVAALERTAVQAGLELERVWGAGTQYCQVLLRRPA